MGIKKICVLGAGLMGSGIAQVCAQAGFDVVLRDIEEDLLENGFDTIRESLERLEKADKLEEDIEDIIDRIEGTTDLEKALENTDLVIEAVPEDMDLKKKIYQDLEEVADEDTIFASNTSSLMITDLAAATDRPEKFIGMHWFNPPPVMALIEVIRGADTSDKTFETIMNLSEKLGKKPIEAADGPGFFTSRYLNLIMAEAVDFFERGVAGIKEIDEMCKMGFNWPMGPFELADYVGLDTMLHVLEYLYEELGDPKYAPPLTLKKLVKSGYVGKKPGSKGGFYEYFDVEKE